MFEETVFVGAVFRRAALLEAAVLFGGGAAFGAVFGRAELLVPSAS